MVMVIKNSLDWAPEDRNQHLNHECRTLSMGILQARIWMGHHALLRGIFPTRDQTQVSHIAGGFFTIRASKEALLHTSKCLK